ncbi:MAG: aldehyde dehydrogenase family protein [Flavobacteriales bacterium TMED191]|nr:MAG: aldehyde dehydrogenase family protein [Flavobacteriales bacterium TMED191]
MKELDNLLYNQKKHFSSYLVNLGIKDRISKIKKIRAWISDNKELIIQTCQKDYYKPVAEIYATEINPILNHIDFTLKHIKRWVKRQSVWTPLHLLGSSSKIYYEPKGVCLVISPWNYPFNLTVNPLVSAIAAGNCVVIKPSEHTPNMSKLLDEMVSLIFDKNEICVVNGDSSIGSHLISLKFDHIFFTGSPEIGKIVMGEAAKNLCSVTLELGGKNHTVVDSNSNIKSTAEKIIWSKFVNSGQTCIAANHVFVHSDIYDAFILCLKNTIDRFFENNSDYASIINEQHLNRLKSLQNQCLENGGELYYQSPDCDKKNSFPITLIKLKDLENPILKSEIFGPILPILSYTNLGDVINFIKSDDKTLALYFFTKTKSLISYFIKSTSSGTVAINECMLQYSNPYLLFGGVNSSGMGKVGRNRGFLAFSNEKSVLFQMSNFSIAKFIYPPYTLLKQKIAKLIR